MSDKNENKNDEILARNVGELLRHSHKPPRIDPGASARIFAALEKRLPEAPAKTEKAETPKSAGLLSGVFSALFATPARAGVFAAAVAAAVVVGGLVLNRGERAAPAAPFEPVELANAEVAPKRVELADGTSLILRSGASLVTTGPRSIELREGDVLFDVAKGDSPFVISRPGTDQRVVVLGTRFVLEADDDSTMAAVIRGSVRLEASGQELVLAAGQGGEARGEGPPARKPIPRLSHLVSWSRAARARAEGTDAMPVRQGNLVARFANWGTEDYPLPVRNFGIDIHLENQVARVAIDQTFFNEHPSDLEGLYSFSLPSGAAISRLAMYVNGELMEAGIAERARARQVYESIVYRRRDPALMEWMAGNEVKVRIFPLFGRQEKRILLSYTQSLERLYDDIQLTVPLPRLERPVGALRLRAKLVGCAECEVVSTSHSIQTRPDGGDLIVELEAKQFQIEDDLLLSIRQPSSTQKVVAKRVGDDHLVLARVTPELGGASASARKPRRWVILHDTSGSRSPIERKAQVHVVDRLIDELDERDEVAMVAFDATVRTLDDGAFVAVANADRKAMHDFAEEEGRAGVGFTDLGKGLEAATKLLASATDASDYEPMIIYLGDGVVTGGARKPGELVGLVAGKATVVAIAIGATYDESVLGGLAGETGGMSAVLNPGQDLDWRVFDLVASLHGERITDLRGELDGSEAPVYVSTRQLAAGEEISIVTRTGAELPAALRLRGTRAGKPWTMEVPLGPGMVSEDASYLPRLWARARIAALLDAEALEEGTDHRAEVTALALEHWLLTPYTSLLVLENDAAYKRFKVARSSMDGWAAYKVDKKIKVVSEPLTAGIDLTAASIGALVFRAPVPLFNIQQAQQHYYSRRSSGWGTIGAGDFGLIGHGGGGSGTGNGFGMVGGMADGKSVWLPQESGGERAKNEEARDFADVSGMSDALGRDLDLVTTANKGRLSFRGPRRRRVSGRGRGAPAFDSNLAPRQQMALGASLATEASYATPVVPAAMLWPSDRRFEDLTSLLPAMFSSELDRQAARLVRDTSKKKDTRYAIEPAAATMISRARELAGRRRYRDGENHISIDSTGRFNVNRRTLTGLVENLRYNGESLVTEYPELDIAIRRVVAAAEPILLESEAPMLLARPEHLARFYSIAKVSETVVSLSPPKSKWKLLLTFDDQGRVLKLERSVGAVKTTLFEISYEGSEVTVTRGSSKTSFTVEAMSDSGLNGAAVTASVEVQLPLRHPGFIKAQLTSNKTRTAQRQLLASYAALGLFSEASKLAEDMASDSPLVDGELVLASGAVTVAAQKNAGRILARGNKDSTVFRYVSSASRYRFNRASSELAAIAKDTGWLGSLALLRQSLTVTSLGGSSAPSGKLLSALIKRESHQAFAYLGTFSFDQYQRWRAPKTVLAKWEELVATNGDWANASQVRLAYALATAGKYELAARKWETIRDAALDAGQLPLLDYQTASAFRGGPRSEAGWQVFWGTTRERVLDSGDTRLMIGLLQAAQNLGLSADIPRIATAAADNGMTTAQRLEVIMLVSRSGLTNVARRLFEPLESAVASGKVTDPAVLRIASGFASARGHHYEAATLFRNALSLEADEAPLHQIRSEYARLISLYASAAQLGTEDERSKALAAMLEASSDWRALDPDNASHDRQMATALFSLGDSTEAMRFLSTAIERRPMEGRSFEVVATALESQGRAVDAIGLWERAIEVEPENPTWALRLARVLSAAGRSTEAKVVLDKVIARKDWHERFQWIVSQAKQTRKQL